jgi:hypothetical protein
MANSIEGLTASYVGPDTADGLRSGDRCFVLSDERSIVHVRWVTGAATDTYGELSPREIVADTVVLSAREDEFGFEAGGPTGPVGLNVQALYDRGGEVALLAAMEHTGALESLRAAARQAVETMRLSISQDPCWQQVEDALGEDASPVVASAIMAALDVETSSADDWEDEDDDYLS